MPADFDTGFFVRVPAWHGLGIVLDDYPGREEAMRLAGHDFDVIEVGALRMQLTADQLINAGQVPNGIARTVPGWKAHCRSDTLQLLHVSKDSYERIPNSVPYDFAELLLDQGFQYETGITLRGGAVCALTLKLDEPVVIQGDDSVTLPYLGLSWAHDGSASLKGRSTTVRQVCANTVAASEAEGARLGTDFSIRHTKNWKDRVEDAKMMMKGVRDDFAEFQEIANELASINVTEDQRELFVHTLIPLQVASAGQLVSDRVIANVDEARSKVFRLFNGPTIPDAHKLTAYGLQLAGVEYLDHLRGYRNSDSYVGRTLLKHEPAKAKLRKMIADCVAA